jgi:hypothetical protein
MLCDTKMSLLKSFEQAKWEFDLAQRMAGSAVPFEQRVQDQSSAHLNLVNTRLAYVDHVAGCPICAGNRRALDT